MAGSIHFVPQDDVSQEIDNIVDTLSKAAPFAKVSRSAVINVILRRGLDAVSIDDLTRTLTTLNRNVNCA